MARVAEDFKKNGPKQEGFKMNTSFEAIEKVREDMVSLTERLGSLVRSLMGAQAEEKKEEKAPVAAEAASAVSVEGNGKAKPSQSELVRRYLKEHGEARNKDIIDLIKRHHGVDVAASLVSYLRSKEFAKGAPKKKSKAPTASKMPARTERIVSGSAIIRHYLERNPGASNEEVVKELKKTRKIEVRPTLVSSVRAILKKKGMKTSKIKRKAKGKKARKGLPMPALVVRALERGPRDGMKLREMTEKVVASGYEYHGSKGWEGIAQNVYQAVHALSKTVSHPGYEGKTPVILHDEASKRWRLNPKAVKKDVA